jgi:hypothetical protein
MEDKILSRIRKMMAIANDSAASEAERDTALQMSYRLLAKHNLTMLQVEDQGSREVRGTYEEQGWSQTWAKHVCLNVAKLFFCEYYIGDKINATKCVHHFVGLESNATTAMLMSSYIINSILKEGRKRYTHNLSPETRSFALGVVARLSQRIAELIKQTQQDATPGTALVLIDLYQSEKQANEALLPANLEAKRSRSSSVKRGAYESGKEFGSSINLSKQISADTADYKQIR